MVRGREADAFRILESSEANPDSILVAQQLANYLRCVELQSKKDHSPELGFLKDRFGVTPENVGIKISACLIVKDEEECLGRCLESLKGAVDEIVVVDTGSKDRTVEIAQSYGAVMGTFEWCNDFSAARNASLELATGNWILWIDADEVLDPGSARAFQRAVTRPQFGGFNIQIINYTEKDSEYSVFEHHPIRLFRNLPSVRFTGKVHEQIVHGLQALELPGATLEGATIHHYGYTSEMMEAKGKIDRTITLLEHEVRNQPEEAFHWFNLCNTLYCAERWAESEHAGRQCVQRLRENDPYGAMCYQLLTGAMIAQGKLDVAIEFCDQATARGYGGILVEYERANAYLKMGDGAGCLAALEKCGVDQWPEGMTGDRSIVEYKRNIIKGQALALLGRYDEALAELDFALAKVPNYGPALYSRAATLEKKGDTFEAYEAFLKARSDAGILALATKGAARTALALGILQAAAKLFKEAWEADPDDYGCWVGWTEAATAWGDTESILLAYEAFVKHHEPTNEVLINWGRALAEAGQDERALTCFTEVIKRDPTQANAYFNCGDLLYRNGAFSDAAHLYETGLRVNPNHADGWFMMGNALAQMNLDEGAKLAYRQALQINPSHAGVLNNLEVIAA
ncbi:MAG: tetratricopeptide repeat protein [Armatimonadetes bacterium]|nr:tetratricopeptide repeat protein [Armatimonadota bacterium]